MKNKLVLVGAGGFGREVAWQFSDQYEMLGFVDDAPGLQGKTINGLPVLGGNDFLLNHTEEINAVICIANPKSRKKMAEKLSENPLIKFPTIVAGDAKHSETVNFGKGCIICLSGILTVNIELGDFVVTNWDCTIGHDVIIGDYVTLYPSVNVSGNVEIGTCAEIGTGTNIIQGKKIGAHSIIGAGSVVVKDIPENCTAVGVPAFPIKYHQCLQNIKTTSSQHRPCQGTQTLL